MKKKYKDVYYDVPDVKTIKELVIHGVGEGKDQPLFMYDNVNGTKDNPFITKTFNDVWHDINCLGTYMFAHGVKDCNVAIIGENSYEWIIAFFANLLGKIVSVPLDPKLPAEDLAVQLNEGECKAIFYSEYYAPTVEKIKEIGAPMDTYLYIPDFQSFSQSSPHICSDIPDCIPSAHSHPALPGPEALEIHNTQCHFHPHTAVHIFHRCFPHIGGFL